MPALDRTGLTAGATPSRSGIAHFSCSTRRTAERAGKLPKRISKPLDEQVRREEEQIKMCLRYASERRGL